MTIWHTADIHAGHHAILGFCDRPWDTVEEMHIGIAERWNYHVDPADTVYIEGDAAMGIREQTLPFFTSLNGKKILVPGNHDTCFPGGSPHWRKKLELYQNYMDVEFFLPPQLTLPHALCGTFPVQLAHFPRVNASRYDDRYIAWRPPLTDEWLLHGHTHDKERMNREFRQIHVGIDAWDYAPVAEETILELIQKED